MRLLLTGAEGFTGRHLRVEAEAAGFEVIGLKSDITDAAAVATEVLAVVPTHVAHLAAISAVTHADEEAFYRVNLFGSLNLLNALVALPQRPKKVLLASSANVYGNQGGEVAIAEKVCPKPVNHYAMSKLAMEHMAANYTEVLPLVITRPFNYTGVGHDQRFVIPKIVAHFRQRQSIIELGSLDVHREYNDVRMVAHVYLKLLSQGKNGEIYNVCTGKAYSLHEVVAAAAALTGQSIDVVVNQAYVRPNELQYLTGDPTKLINTVGSIEPYDLNQTLAWMLQLGTAHQVPSP